MTKRLGSLAVLAVLAVAPVLVARTPAGTTHPDGSRGLVAHEWGTFTSIAGESGRAVEWVPHTGSTDLPCFVERVRTGVKRELAGTVRMETPVIYFYAPGPVNLDVSVRFRQGVMTEWFPRTAGTQNAPMSANTMSDTLTWKNIRVEPGGSARFPLERGPNHYYVARETDAAPLQVGADRERFLFYRGVGRLPPPIAAVVLHDGNIAVSQTRREALGDIILFENRDGASAYKAVRTSSVDVTFPPLNLQRSAPSPQAYLEQVLVEHGLYPREAKAMVESWRGSWFEQGTRVFYIVSSGAVDAMLPLNITPMPSELKRVFVGRMEIVTGKTLEEVRVALARNDRNTLARYGRFLQPFAARLLSGLPKSEQMAFDHRLQSFAPSPSQPGACGSSLTTSREASPPR